MFRGALFVLLSGVMLCGSARAEEDRPQWANPDRWEFLGALTFDVASLRDALAADIDVLLASRAPVDAERLATVLSERLAAGYRHGGFPEVEVTPEIIPERQRIALTVKEGPGYLNGDVRVVGAKTIPVDELIEGLVSGTGPQDAFLRWSEMPGKGRVREWIKANGESAQKEAAVWKQGKPTAFDAAFAQSVVAKARLVLQRCGFSEPVVRASLEPEADGQTTLVVTIDDEGPQTVLGAIEVHGNKFNTREQILGYLEIQPGQNLDIESAARWKWKLDESARFYETKVEVIPPPFGTGPSRLDVHVVEIPNLPQLDQSFTAQQQAAITAARWMTAVKREDWQLTARVKLSDEYKAYMVNAWDGAETVTVQLTLSAKEGAGILEVDARDGNEASIWAAHAHLDRDRVALVNLTRKAKLTFNVAKMNLMLNANWSVRKPDNEGRASQMFFGFGFNSDSDKDHHLPEIRTVVSPAAILLESLKPEFQATLEDGTFRLTKAGTLIEFDAVSGRLEQFTARDEDKLTITLQAETGLYQTRLKEISPAYATCKETMRDDVRMTQICRFALDEIAGLEFTALLNHPESLSVLHRLLDAGVLHEIDQKLQSKSKSDGQQVVERSNFEIPPDVVNGPVDPLSWLKPFLQVAFRGYSLVFPRETGTWVAGREAALSILAGKKGAMPPGRIVEVLDHADAGPISFLLAAELFHFVSPYHRYVLSNAALERLDSPALRSDLRVLTNERSLAGKIVLAVVTALRDASPDDLAVVASWMTKAQFDDVLQPAFRELSRRKDEPLSRVLPDVLEQVYPALIRPALLAELHRLEAPVRAAQAQPAIKP